MLLNDLQMVYSKAKRETMSRMKNNPIMIIMPAAYSVLLYYANMLMGNVMRGVGGFAYGFITPIITVLVLSSYYEMLSDLNAFGRISFRNFKNSFTRNFASIYSVLFIMFIINNLLNLSFSLLAIVTIGIFVVFNPIAEAIYIRGESYVEAYSYSANFMKENIIQWGLPLALYLVIVLVLTNLGVVGSMLSDVVSIPIGVSYGITDVARFMIIEVITAFYVVFRGSLFNILSKSTMRKRAYMGGLDW